MSDTPGRSPMRESDPLPHYVSDAPYDPNASAPMTDAQRRFYSASPWMLMWWKFRRHRLAVISGLILLLLYLAAAIAEFIAPYDLHTRHSAYIFAPPQRVHFVHEGQFLGPFVYALKTTRDMETLQTIDACFHPIGITYDAPTHRVWVACYGGAILVYDDRR